MKKRILSLVLCAAMLLSMCLFLGAGVANSLTVCDSGGEAVKRVDLPVNQKISLTAQAQSAAENDAYQWQIQAAKNVWANILGSDTQTLELSYPMVASALSEKNTVQIRCRLTSAETGEATFSDAVTVEVTAATAVDTPASADAAAAPVLRSPAKVAAAANDAPEYGTYTIIIKYQFADGRQAAPSWSATVATGSPYTQDIQSPVVVGYTPSETVVHVNTSEAKIYTVTYQPAEVEFTVKHYRQNVDDDNYTLLETETKNGYTESPVGDKLATTYEGFYSLLYDTTTKIAADGSTVVEIYYDRYYYLMNFDLDGGYGVEPVYARYDAPINVGTPTKPGYSFNGWNPELPKTMPVVPKDAQPYKATWKAGSADYLVQYWLENANDANYSYDTSVRKSAAVGAVINGSGDKSYTGFYFDHADQNVTVNGDGTSVVNVYYKRNTWTLRFEDVRGALKCTKTEHSHSDSCCKYGGTSITHWWHDDSCCKLGLSNHTHNDNCYYDYVEFKNIKYGEDTTKYWDKAPSGYLWYTAENGDTFYTAAPDMPNKDLTIYGQRSSGRSSTIHYYEEGTTTSIKPDLTVQKTDWNFTPEDHVAIPGFTYSSEKVSGSQYYLYYTRNSYKLDFNNKGTIVKSKTISYDGALKSHNFVPGYPDGLEPNAYQFAGWYTDPGCTNAVDWDTAKMPYNNTVFYAKWVPVTHTVKTYLTENDLNSGAPARETWTVSHGKTVDPPANPTNGNYPFVGWFYKDADGTEHAFDFSMPVTKDLNLYAKWSSNTLVEYTIKYAVRNEDGTYTYIADDTKGSALALTTKTFEAKTGTQLKDGYQSGYFPKTSSHSIIMDINGGNEYTFEYVKMPEVKYTVKYLDKATGEPVVVNGEPTPDKTETTSKAVVTETFMQITGYAPDAYQKRLVLSANEDENVLVFWYTKDTKHAPVQIVHEIQNIEGDGYTEYQSSTNLNGVIGEKYDETPLTIPGFRYNERASTASGKLTAAGLVLTLKYDRIEYPYEFRFLEQGTNKQLKKPVTETARYQAQVTQKAETIPGYTLVSAENQAINIAIEDPAGVAKKNVKTFYYQEQTVDIKYVAVGFGTLDNVQDSNVKVLSGTVQGSTPTANEGYKFVGWYTDAGCTQQVKSNWVGADNKLTPQQSVKYGDRDGYGAKTYYAKFERDVFDLKITKNVTGEGANLNQTFVFTVKNEANETISTIVLKNGETKTIKGLPVGTYTVTEDTAWSWQYKAENATQTVTPDGAEAAVTFTNAYKGTNWLTSLAKAINTWAGGTAHEK